MPGNVLVIGYKDSLHSVDQPWLDEAGLTPIGASLYESRATSAHPYWKDVLTQCLQNGVKLDGVILYDDSMQKDSTLLNGLHAQWVAAGDEIQELQQLTNPGIEIGVTTGDIVQDSLESYKLQQRLNDQFAAHKKDRIQALQDMQETTEYYMTRSPSLQEGIACIKALKAQDSLYQDVPIIVGHAFPDKKPEFEAAGAAVVRTSDDGYSNNTDLLLEAIAAQNKWAGSKKSLADFAKNPPGGTRGFGTESL